MDVGRDALTATGQACGSCSTVLPPNSKFCNECGTPVTPVSRPAEYKQVTVLFADVVHSMDIAAAVGAERLREIMTELATACAAVVTRNGGTVGSFTGDGIMAVFGAPAALEDHAVRACLTALNIQDQIQPLSDEVRRSDGVELRLRVGLNSGQVIAGEIGSKVFGYTAVGEQVGMAQRMESVAPPGGVMLSGSTARLVDNIAVLGEQELVHIKGASEAVPARRLLGMRDHRRAVGPGESSLIGRRSEMATFEGLLARAIAHKGGVLGVVGQAGIGKTRLVRDVSAIAAARGVEVFPTACESHADSIPFYAVARFLRTITGVGDLDGEAARVQVRSRLRGADVQDLLLLDHLLGIGDRGVTLPQIAPDARRRRLIAMINAASLDRRQPGMFIIEDVHWIDEVSESMMVEILAAIVQTPSLVVLTYRSEYRGPLVRMANFQQISLAPLNDSQTDLLVTELLGGDSSVGGLRAVIIERAAGNPFFVAEIVRDLAERGVLQGCSGAYQLTGSFADAAVPATLQSTIGARIDRLDATAKRTLNAAAVIGTRFTPRLLGRLIDGPDLDALTAAEFVSEVPSSSRGDYAFCHPLIRTVAYESQLKSDRAQTHRLLAAHLDEPETADENASAIAGHLESAGDLGPAFGWHMRAGFWYNYRDITAARTSWARAQSVADRLPEGPEFASMRIAPRTLLCGTVYRVGGLGVESAYEELRSLCTAANDQRSLAIGMAGRVLASNFAAHRREASQLADDLGRLLESIGDSTLTVALSFAAMLAKHETAEMTDVLRWAERVIDLAEGDATKGNLILASPLILAIVLRGVARWSLGLAGWRDDLDDGTARSRDLYPTMLAGIMWRRYISGIAYGVLLPDGAALCDSADTLAIAERDGDDLALNMARLIRGVVLVHGGGAEYPMGLALLEKTRERILQGQFVAMALPIAELHLVMDQLRRTDTDAAIEAAHTIADDLFASGGTIWDTFATTVLVEALLIRGGEGDVAEAHTALSRLAAVAADRQFVPDEVSLLRLRALVAHADGDRPSYEIYRDAYRARVTELGFEGHMAMAATMP